MLLNACNFIPGLLRITEQSLFFTMIFAYFFMKGAMFLKGTIYLSLDLHSIKLFLEPLVHH